MIAYPLIALIIGWICSQIFSHFSKRAQIILFLVIFSLPLGMSLITSITFARKDTRLLAAEWVESEASLLEDSVIRLYYDGSGLKEVLPEFAGKFPEREKLLVYPFVLISFCEKSKLDIPPDFFIDDFLRRGESICIYKVLEKLN